MKKNIIITSGPTNERLDAVMKITNMSTGALGSIVADEILETKIDDIDRLYYLSPKLAYKPRVESEKVELITLATTSITPGSFSTGALNSWHLYDDSDDNSSLKLGVILETA